MPNSDGCRANGLGDNCPIANATTIGWTANRGEYSNWGVFFDDCYLYLSDGGSPDNSGDATVVGSPGGLRVLRYTGGPEPNQPLRVSKDPTNFGRLAFVWGEVPFGGTFSLYRGTFGAAFAYDHQMIDSSKCNQPVSTLNLLNQFYGQPNYYYLLTARNACGDQEGNFGHDSSGTERPTAADLGNPTCP